MLVGAVTPVLGAVRIDGARLGDWDRSELGRYIGYMPQEPSLFEGTIKENISRFARPLNAEEARELDEGVIAAAKEAGVHEMILQLPQAYESRLGLMGSGLSLGQAQRIALARALYGSPVILVLDEPNAFLDTAGESALIGALTRARARGATVIVIAHRRGIVDASDELLVLEDGRPKMMGPSSAVVRRLAAPAEAQSGECSMSDALVFPAGPEAVAGDPQPEIRRGIIISVLFFVLFLGWAAFMPLDAGVNAPGTIAVSGNRQTVQHKDGGVVTAIHVREGARSGRVVFHSAKKTKAMVRRAIDVPQNPSR